METSRCCVDHVVPLNSSRLGNTLTNILIFPVARRIPEAFRLPSHHLREASDSEFGKYLKNFIYFYLFLIFFYCNQMMMIKCGLCIQVEVQCYALKKNMPGIQ